MDAIDRRILTLLQTDATRSYAQLGSEVGLSAAATHERVRRLKTSGVIRRTAAVVDARAIGLPLTAFVLVDTKGWGGGDKPAEYAQISPLVEEVHSVAGNACLICKVRANSTEQLEALLERFYERDEVRRTQSYVVLRTYVDRPATPAESPTS